MSARYTVRKEQYAGVSGPISLEVYYDPAHTFNIDEMLAGSRAGLRFTRPSRLDSPSSRGL